MNGTYKIKEELLFDIKKLIIKTDKKYRELIKRTSDMINTSGGMIDTTSYITLQSDIAKSINDMRIYKLAYISLLESSTYIH